MEPIKWKPFRRLALTAAAGLLMLLTLAYWWQSNLVHEIAGLAMFGLVGRHIYVNRQSIVNLFHARSGGRGRVIAALHVALMANMLLLLLTSVAVSQSVFAPLPIPENVTIRDLHWLSAYWLVVTVGIHLGLHWHRAMALFRSSVRITKPSEPRTLALRAVAAAMIVAGLWSCGVMELPTKLSWSRSLAFWDFSTSVAPFFAHWGSVLAFPAIVAHYAQRLLPQRFKVSGPR
jgi:hypothetical protein